MARTSNANAKIQKLETELKSVKAKFDAAKKSLATAELSWKKKLAESIELAYNQGYEQCRLNQEKLDEAFSKHMEKAASEFDKAFAKKIKKNTVKSAATKSIKDKSSAASASDKSTKKRGRPRKSLEVHYVD